MTAETFWTFPKIADTIAQERHGKHWRLFADDYLDTLVGDFWFDRFSEVFHCSGFGKPERITREVAWRMLGLTRPPAFQDVQEPEISNFHALAKVSLEDYGPWPKSFQARDLIFVQFLLDEDEARERICTLVAASNLTRDSRRKGGRAPKYDAGLQQFIDQLFAEFEGEGVRLTLFGLEPWLEKNAQPKEGYDPEPPIPDCGDIEFYDNLIWWKNQQGDQKSAALRTLERYIQRARESTSTEPA